MFRSDFCFLLFYCWIIQVRYPGGTKQIWELSFLFFLISFRLVQEGYPDQQMSTRPIPVPDRPRIRTFPQHRNYAISQIPDLSQKVEPNKFKNHMQNAETNPVKWTAGNPTKRANGFSNRESDPVTSEIKPRSIRRSEFADRAATPEVMFGGAGPSYLKQKTPCRQRYSEPADAPMLPIRPTQNGMTTVSGHA